jgi:type IV pilus assembly protein PilB
MAEKIGQLLLREKLIDEMNLESALSESRSTGMRLGEFLIKHRGFEEEKLYFTLSKQFSIPFIKNIKDEINYDILKELPIELFRKNRCLPLYRNEQFLGVIVSDPLDLDIMMELECVTGLIVETSLAMPSEMETVCKELFKDESFFKDSVGKISREYEKQLQHEDAQLSLEEIRKNIESEPVVKMVSLIFDEAIGQRASDIHIEPSDGNAIIRFRVDGMLRQYMELTKWMYSPLTSRIKILAELDIAEKRVPQDGRIRYSCKNQVYDFRISTLPTHHGEKTVIRILKHDLSLLELENLGIEKQELDLLHEAIEKPQGMIFVTGPTGSGKSSTLFACLNRIKRKEINITTIENPIEYKLDGINQVQINEKAGVTFATTLRSILRQDPDVILVGEIRDKETAEIAIQASQTGHLVLSTLHTNDSVSAITRLKDLKIPGFLISSSLLAIIAQRLVRRLCPDCRIKGTVPNELKLRWSKTIGDIPFSEAYFPAGCKKCNNSGFLGRKGIFEMIPVSDEIRSMITENRSETQLKNYLRSQGMKSMTQSGIEKIKQGITTPEEVLRVVLVDDVAG